MQQSFDAVPSPLCSTVTVSNVACSAISPVDCSADLDTCTGVKHLILNSFQFDTNLHE